MNSTLKSMLIAAAAITSVSAFAQDKATLDLLVKKGIITAEERAKTLDEAAKARSASGLNKVFVKEDAVSRLTFSGRLQTQWEGISYAETSAVGVETQSIDVNKTFLRRVYLGVNAAITDGASAELVWNFADSTMDKAYFSLDTSAGQFNLGYQKVQWGLEENTSSSKLLTVERSMVTRYWAEGANDRRLGFGARHSGLHYSNKATLDATSTLGYGLSVVNENQGFSTTGNDVGYYANLVYGFTTAGGKNAVGLNWGSINYMNASNAPFTQANGDVSKMTGFNPYVQLSFGQFGIQADYQMTTIDPVSNTVASSGGVERKPNGYNVIANYKFNDNYEAVIRYSALDTDGRGQKSSDGFRDSPATSTYDKSSSWYAGVNYYINGHNAKVMLGYEKAKLTDAISGYGVTGSATTTAAKADADIFRLQAQVLF